MLRPPSSFSPEIWTVLSVSPLYPAESGFCASRFVSPRALTPVSARGVPVSPRFLLPGDLAPISLSDCRCIDRGGVISHTHIKSSPKQQQDKTRQHNKTRTTQQHNNTTTHNNTAYFPRVPSFRSPFLCLHFGGSSSCQRDGSREERRLRQWLRHERLSVVMAVAESQHHHAPLGPKMARGGPWIVHTIRDKNFEILGQVRMLKRRSCCTRKGEKQHLH